LKQKLNLCGISDIYASILKKGMNLKLQVPNPCSENWNKMQATPDGKHCKSCDKNLVDLRNLNTQQIYDLVNVDSKVCGLLSESQLQSEFNFKEQHSFSKFGLVVSFASLVAFVNPVRSQDTTNAITVIKPLTNLPSKITIIEKINNIESDTILIKGKVVDVHTNEPLPFVKVYVKSNKRIGAHSDFDGEFTLRIPKIEFDTTVVLLCQYLGYTNVEMVITKGSNSLLFKLDENSGILGDIIVVQKSTVTQKVFDFFRRKKNKKYN